jgi:hypothetical protein
MLQGCFQVNPQTQESFTLTGKNLQIELLPDTNYDQVGELMTLRYELTMMESDRGDGECTKLNEWDNVIIDRADKIMQVKCNKNTVSYLKP